MKEVTAKASFRPHGHSWRISYVVAMTNSARSEDYDETGYRYDASIQRLNAWPEMPDCFLKLNKQRGTEVGFDEFLPMSCLINRMSWIEALLHQDKNERISSSRIVSVSLGVSATFLFVAHAVTTRRTNPVEHGDVIVWGGPARLRYHGVLASRKDSPVGCDAAFFQSDVRKAT